MKSMKIAATVALAVLLFVSGIAAEAVALAEYTVMNPVFFGAGQKEAYDLIGQVVVRKMADGVLANAPPIALRTLDEQRAFALASGALPPGKVSGMLETTAPDIDRFVFSGGDIPVLKGSPEIGSDEDALVKSLLMPEVWGLAAQSSSSFPVLPFTPQWNQTYGHDLTQGLWLLRYYAGFSTQSLWLALAGVALAAGLLYLLWLKERRPFFNITGALLTANGLLLLAPAVALSFWSRNLAGDVAAFPWAAGMAAFFGSSFPELFRVVLWPFREIFYVSALVSLSLGVTMYACGVTTEIPGAPLPAKPWQLSRAAREKAGVTALGGRKPRHARP